MAKPDDDEADVAAGSRVPAAGDDNKDETKKKPTTTKRQRRQRINDKHKWPQMPKIQSSETRAAAYVRVAGLAKEGDDNLAKQTIDPNDPAVRFGRLLGSADQRVRHQAVFYLESYLKQKCDIEHAMALRDGDDNGDGDNDNNNRTQGLSEMDLLKLWKALWHTLYMADKVPVQDELSKHLAKLIWCVAGTEEEDEYAAQVYLEMYGDDAVGFDEDEDEDNDEDEDEDEHDDDEEGVDCTIEEIVNTLNNDDEEEEGSDGEEEEDEDAGEMEEDNDDDDEEEEEVDENIDNSDIPHCRGAHLASLLVRTFFRTVRREWGHMDKYRVDKFYTLMRLVVREVFTYMSLRHWSTGITRIFNDVLHEEILRQTPNGLRYHLIDLTLEELALVNAKAPMPLTEATFLDCLEPYFAMASVDIGDDTVKARVMENIIAKFLEEYSVVSESPATDEDGKPLTMEQVHVGTVAEHLFTLASDVDTPDKDREALYDMHKRFKKAIKRAGKDVDLYADPNGDDDDEIDKDEVIDYGDQPPEKINVVVSEDDHDEPSHDDDGENLQKNKKAKKQKKKKNHNLKYDGKKAPVGDSMTMELSEDGLYDGDIDTPEQARKRKLGCEDNEPTTVDADAKKKKRKKRKKKEKEGHDSDDDHDMEGPDTSKAYACTSTIPKKSADDADDEAEAANVDAERARGKKKKKKKKKAKAEGEAAAAAAAVPGHITISVADQKAARKAMKAAAEEKTPSKKAAKNKKTDTSRSPVSEPHGGCSGKKVKFGDKNMARSWKASMKGLRTLPDASPLPKPEKGILYHKNGAEAKAKKIRARKKASEYF